VKPLLGTRAQPQWPNIRLSQLFKQVSVILYTQLIPEGAEPGFNLLQRRGHYDETAHNGCGCWAERRGNAKNSTKIVGQV